MTARPLSKTAGDTITEEATKKPTVRLATVPHIKFDKSYIHRTFDGGWDEFDIFDGALKKKLNVLIEGPTGPGKTSAVMAYAANRKKEFYAVPSSVGLEPSQLFGKFIPDGRGGFVWQDGPVTDIVRNGGVLLINEVNFVPERVSTVLFSLLDKRRTIYLVDNRGESIQAHEGSNCWCGAKDCTNKMILVIADMNPDYAGTRDLNKAFRNRFAIQLWWDYDPDVESKLVESKTLRLIASQIRERVAQGDSDTPVSTNMLMEFEELAGEFGLAFAVTNFCTHFDGSERATIRSVMDAHRAGLAKDFPEEVEEESDSDFVHDPKLEAKYKGIKTPRNNPWYDPKSGVYGEHWLYQDEEWDSDTEEVVNIRTGIRHKLAH